MKHIDLEPPDKLPPDDTHCKYPGCGKSFSSKEERTDTIDTATWRAQHFTASSVI
jgi:hypothetical protein